MDATEPAQSAAGPHQLRRLLDAVVGVSSDLELSTVLRRVVDAAAELAGARYVALGVLDERREVLVEFVTVGVDEETRAAIGDFPRGHGILGTLIHDPRPLRLPDLTLHPDSYGFPPNHPPMRSFLGVPILVRGEAFGNLYLCDKINGDVFDEIDEELVVTLAGAAAVAIDNAHLHARVAEVALLEDRDRIARDLHDTVIQRLFAVGLSLQGAARMTDDPALTIRIDQAVDDLDSTVREVRSAIFELHAGTGPTQSIRQSVLAVCAESARALGFEPTITIDGPVDTLVDASTGEHVVAVAREALSNVAKHARARQASLHLRAEGGQLHLRVEDDGRGISSPGIGGRGVDNIRLRAQRLGGTVSIASAPERGTVVDWSVPLH